MPPDKVVAIDVKGACPWCSGNVLSGYKRKEEFQKCYGCHRVSWKGQVVKAPISSTLPPLPSIKRVPLGGQGAVLVQFQVDGLVLNC